MIAVPSGPGGDRSTTQSPTPGNASPSRSRSSRPASSATPAPSRAQASYPPRCSAAILAGITASKSWPRNCSKKNGPKPNADSSSTANSSKGTIHHQPCCSIVHEILSHTEQSSRRSICTKLRLDASVLDSICAHRGIGAIFDCLNSPPNSTSCTHEEPKSEFQERSVCGANGATHDVTQLTMDAGKRRNYS